MMKATCALLLVVLLTLLLPFGVAVIVVASRCGGMGRLLALLDR